MEASLIPQISHGIMDEEDELGTPSSSSSGDDDSLEFMEDATSPSTSSSSSPPSCKDQGGPLYKMSSLVAHLPFKRGLSQHFHGKSQSFTSLSNARCLDDLAKPERPCRKKLKPCKSYGGGLDAHNKPLSPKGCWSRAISKTPSRATLSSSASAKRQGFPGSSRPPTAPHRPGSFTSPPTLLFA